MELVKEWTRNADLKSVLIEYDNTLMLYHHIQYQILLLKMTLWN